MTEPDLEKLIANWYRRPGAEDERLRLKATSDCPPLTRLWRHVAQGEPLAEYQDHVGLCPRCRRLCGIIERESAPPLPGVGDRTGAPPLPGVGDGTGAPPLPPLTEAVKGPGVGDEAGDRRRRIYIRGGLLAAAACIALIFVSWPQPSFDADITAFAEQAYMLLPAPVRGHEDEKGRPAQRPRPLPWITAALSDPAVQDALAVHAGTETTILLELHQGRLRIDPDGRIALADGADEADAHRLGLHKLIDRDRAACDAIIDALVQHVPGALEKHRPALRRALDRWRAENVFGGD